MCNKTGQLMTRNSRHVKTTQIKAKQYLQDTLDKHRKIDPVEDILKNLKNRNNKPKHTPTMNS